MASTNRANKSEKLVVLIREISGEERLLKDSLFNTERSDSGISALLNATIKRKDRALTQLMSLYVPFAKNIAKGYKKRAEGVGLSYGELCAIGAEAMVLEIARQRWLSLDKALTSLIRQAITGAIKQKIKEERKRNGMEMPISTVKKKDIRRAQHAVSNNEPTDEEIADKMAVFYERISEVYAPLSRAAAGAFSILKSQKSQKAMRKALNLPTPRLALQRKLST